MPVRAGIGNPQRGNEFHAEHAEGHEVAPRLLSVTAAPLRTPGAVPDLHCNR